MLARMWRKGNLHALLAWMSIQAATMALVLEKEIATHSSIWRRQWHPTPVLLPGKFHGRRSLVGCSPWGHKELDTTERLHFHFSLSCSGEGNGNPLQCSCLENPRDGGAWWAAVYGVTQSWTRLKWLSSSSSRPISFLVLLIGETHFRMTSANFPRALDHKDWLSLLFFPLCHRPSSAKASSTWLISSAWFCGTDSQLT